MSFGENFCIDIKEQFKAIMYDFYVSVYKSKSYYQWHKVLKVYIWSRGNAFHFAKICLLA